MADTTSPAICVAACAANRSTPMLPGTVPRSWLAGTWPAGCSSSMWVAPPGVDGAAMSTRSASAVNVGAASTPGTSVVKPGEPSEAMTSTP